MLSQTKTAPLLVTVVDLASKDFTDTCDYGPMRAYRTVRILSRQTLPQKAIANLVKRNPGFFVAGIHESNYWNDEF